MHHCYCTSTGPQTLRTLAVLLAYLVRQLNLRPDAGRRLLDQRLVDMMAALTQRQQRELAAMFRVA